MKSESSYETLFQALVEIRKDLHERINSLDERIRETQLKSLEDAFQRQKEAFADCLDGMDQELIKIAVYFEEYQGLYSSLKELHEKRIPNLGGTPSAMPEPFAGNSLMEILAARLEYLKSQGKIQDR